MTLDQAEIIRLLFYDRPKSVDRGRLGYLRSCLNIGMSHRRVALTDAWDAMVAYIEKKETENG